MTIFGTGYQPIDYRPTSRLRRAAAIARLEFHSLFRSRWGTILFVVCLIPTFAGVVILLFTSGLWDIGGPGLQAGMARRGGSFDPSSPQFYLAPALDVGRGAFLFALLLTTIVSARSIAKDRAAQALEILWTRGITPIEYFLAKWFGSFLLLAVSMVVGPMLLWLLARSVATDPEFAAATWAFMPRVVLALIVFVALLTGAATIVSALARSANFASIAWVALMLGSLSLVQVFTTLLRSETALRLLSPWDNFRLIAETIAGTAVVGEVGAGQAVVAVMIVGLLLAPLIRRRLRLAEAVA